MKRDYHGTVRDALSDPLVQLLMKADGVDVPKLEIMLTDLAHDLKQKNKTKRGPCAVADVLKFFVSKH